MSAKEREAQTGDVWEMYYRKSAVKHTFPMAPQFWVRLRRLSSLPYGESRRMFSLPIIGLRRDPDMLDEETLDKLRTLMEEDDRTLAKLIVDWNLTDPRSGELLPLPTPEDTSPLYALPREFVDQMQTWLRQDSALGKEGEPHDGIPPQS